LDFFLKTHIHGIYAQVPHNVVKVSCNDIRMIVDGNQKNKSKQEDILKKITYNQKNVKMIAC